jgi:excisionase family DNA binding protein
MGTDIKKDLEEIKKYSLLSAKNVLTLDDVALLTGLSKSFLYKLTCTKEIPHYKPAGKMLYFDRKEIEDWQKRGRIASNAEVKQLAINSL